MLLRVPRQEAQAVTLHRDLVAVLDVSGSMSGEKLDQAKAALAQLLGTLRPSDRFRVITFSSDVRRYAPGWTDASGEHVRDAQQWVRALSAKVSSPVLTDLTLRADGSDLYDVQPGSLPDLFAGDELVVFGRFRRGGSGEWSVTVNGRRNGHPEGFTTSARRGAQTGSDYIPQLWAARKAGALAREIRLHGQNPEIVNELKRLALRYGILTEYTSYLVQEPNQVVVRPLLDRVAPAPAAQVGALSVDQARPEAKAAAVANAAEAADMDEAMRGRVAGQASRRVGGRLFVRRDSVWTDVAHGDSLPVVRVAAFSDAYFALLRALPELVKPAALEPAG